MQMSAYIFLATKGDEKRRFAVIAPSEVEAREDVSRAYPDFEVAFSRTATSFECGNWDVTPGKGVVKIPLTD